MGKVGRDRAGANKMLLNHIWRAVNEKMLQLKLVEAFFIQAFIDKAKLQLCSLCFNER
jgi:cAMP phosphodiesterase